MTESYGYACANAHCNRYIDPDFVQSIDWAMDDTRRILIRWTCECTGDRVRSALYTLVPRLLYQTMRGAPVHFPYRNVNYLCAVQDNDPTLTLFRGQLSRVGDMDDVEEIWDAVVPPTEPLF